jgi:hypothetical protein
MKDMGDARNNKMNYLYVFIGQGWGLGMVRDFDVVVGRPRREFDYRKGINHY